MGVGGRPEAERALQQDLAWRAGQQVGAAHDLGNALELVVATVRSIGPVLVLPEKTRIAVQVRRASPRLS